MSVPAQNLYPAGSQDAEHINRVLADWQIIADLAFSDLVLWRPGNPEKANDTTGFVALAQARPFTSQTTLHRDVVGSSPRVGLKPLLQQAWATSEPVSPANVPNPGSPMGVGVWPVLRSGHTIAVLTVHQNLSSPRTPSELEKVYRQCAEDMLKMTATGLWPDPGMSETSSLHGNPRVGDGLVRVDAQGLVNFVSPNAVSAFRKLGVTTSLDGRQLSRVALDHLDPRKPADDSLPTVLFGRATARAGIDTSKVNLTLRSIPLRNKTERFGALVLLRDVTEIRRRDHQLVGKDATIREIHHRVKNNLQTVGSLLRMQSRRMSSDEARHGLEQAMKRVDTIALVHETLSHTLDQNVDMDALLSRQFKLSVEVASGTQPVETVVRGKFGNLPGESATPLALIINELAGNAVEHGTPSEGGVVTLTARRKHGDDGRETLIVTVEDEGAEQHHQQQPAEGSGLGLQIVKTLVSSDLGGSIVWNSRSNGAGDEKGTKVILTVPLD